MSERELRQMVRAMQSQAVDRISLTPRQREAETLRLMMQSCDSVEIVRVPKAESK